MLNRRVKPIAAAVGTTFVASLATATVAQADELFVAEEMEGGYDRLAQTDEQEGKCGEGKCGEDKDAEAKDGEGKCGEGKCGEDKDAEGKCGEGKDGEGKDGEGKCGS
ncbi:MAG: hypothetical protein QF921_07875 [Pseudomonadales bacterium]|nr:hypothetical protein [Pseudomonadales bacterium]MDP6471752.1 hypothetical protein [Pseudomonadales bacterium]MDP6971416.1 hypothetical protein [Pseudomonadales bacterium]